ncbi:hypothetical protein SAMN04488511_1164 [Pedobacter suwonensis]|uniref:Uncharacterized protein n=1 Tax=Pedobacter suwonensis TaxID=332999 RepID=A0A1I0TXF1_9SPHI|nr:hypothetical protein [Pedobacter suwonensis]SFA56442.1 hypothetical protein SAMN04488511_1164 [Pedobacter suwonensis]
MKNKNRNYPGKGRVVMVHPHLTTDPVARQGYVGHVTRQKDADTVVVTFDDGTSGMYQADALLTLRPKQEILDGLLSAIRAKHTDEALMQQLYQLVIRNRYKQALPLAFESEATGSICLVAFDRWQQLAQHTQKARSLKPK